MLTTCFPTELQPRYPWGSSELHSRAWKFHQLLSLGDRVGEAHSLSRESKDEFPAVRAARWDTLNLYRDQGENSGDPQDLFLGGQQVQVAESDFCGHWWGISHSSSGEVTWGPEEETLVVVVGGLSSISQCQSALASVMPQGLYP